MTNQQSSQIKVLIRYDGKYEGLNLEDARSYTVMSHTVVNGRDLYKASFTGAKQLMAALRGTK